jgi:hypothetical protein
LCFKTHFALKTIWWLSKASQLDPCWTFRESFKSWCFKGAQNQVGKLVSPIGIRGHPLLWMHHHGRDTCFREVMDVRHAWAPIICEVGYHMVWEQVSTHSPPLAIGSSIDLLTYHFLQRWGLHQIFITIFF